MLVWQVCLTSCVFSRYSPIKKTCNLADLISNNVHCNNVRIAETSWYYYFHVNPVFAVVNNSDKVDYYIFFLLPSCKLYKLNQISLATFPASLLHTCKTSSSYQMEQTVSELWKHDAGMQMRWKWSSYKILKRTAFRTSRKTGGHAVLFVWNETR